MISSIRFKFGRAPGTTSESIKTTPVTVFVGPNNSGKSRILREVQEYCYSGRENTNNVIVGGVDFSGMTAAGVSQVIKRLQQEFYLGETLLGIEGKNITVRTRHGNQVVLIDQLKEILEQPFLGTNVFCHYFLANKTLMLDGPGRIGHVNAQQAGDLLQPAQTSLQVLFRDDVKRNEVRRIVYDAFGVYFVVDPTNLGLFRIRLSDRPPKEPIEECGIHADARSFHAAAKQIEQASDGVKAFTGIITEVIAGDPRVILIDEPEAFLHPSLAFKLGYEVSRAALSEDKRLFVSTHSSQFVMGCIQSGAPINIVRLTYRNGVATARTLPSENILELMRHPLLRSTGVVSGLFYEFVVVTESDADRAFYQEINERLIQFKPEWGIPNCLFINAQNKQTVHTIIRPLRQLGIPAAAIVDIDVLKEGGAVWSNLLSGANVPVISLNAMASMRSSVKTAMDATKKDMKRDGGLSILLQQEKESAENLIGQLSDYGVFVVPGGELESWLKKLNSIGHGPGWLISIFEKMGEDPTSSGYIKPSDGDVWRFLSSVRAWLVNTSRKGIPL